MRVLVCGGRDYTDRDKVFAELDSLHNAHHFTYLIEGGARGADRLAYAWAISHGIHGMEYPAEWDEYGHAAGPIRNRRMLDHGKPDLVVAFPGGSGTADMIGLARAAGVPVVEIAP